MVTIDEIAWYPLRITYSQEMKVKEYLDKEHIESFIPMRYVEKECQGKKTRQLVPAIHNLLFIHTCRKKIEEFKRFSLLSSKIRYIMDNNHVPNSRSAGHHSSTYIRVHNVTTNAHAGRL